MENQNQENLEIGTLVKALAIRMGIIAGIAVLTFCGMKCAQTYGLKDKQYDKPIQQGYLLESDKYICKKID